MTGLRRCHDRPGTKVTAPTGKFRKGGGPTKMDPSIGYPDFLAEGTGECRKHDPDIFAEEGRGVTRAEAISYAKAVCHTCPFQEPCLEWALATDQPHMVWGGKTTSERLRLLSRRGRHAA